jgi:pyrroline-5-carboxylate reductase
MKNVTLAFIGGGNMATSLIGGLLADHVAPAQMTVTDTNPAALQAVGARFGVQTTADNSAAVARADVLVLAVKPQVLKSVAQGVAAAVQTRQPLVISVAAGVRCNDLARWLGGDVALVRAMPNTPALLQTGATALFATAPVTAAQRDLAESILRAVGLTLWVTDEDQMDAVTALSGSGPAYFFLLMEAMEDAAVALGLEPQTARLLTQQTALGAARVAIESEESPADLRRRVTSPGGTTEQAIGSFQRAGLPALVLEAMSAARDRAVELSKQLGEG